ncbi:hypothetical protein ACHAW5_009067 [Stephanodiscus triporus]|uniref:carbonic anhydrase n=1 Tax=Stephanodiscus triporus TaxID=2934178 RepID=A0ABD3NLR7_9STRA
MVDGSPERVALLQFDLSSLLGDTPNRPNQVLSAKLRLYSMTSQSMFGGHVSVIPNGHIDEDRTTWDDTPYAVSETGMYVGSFRAVWPEKFYEIDLTGAFRGAAADTMPTGIVVRISSDKEKAVTYRSRDGGGPNGPILTLTFAYDPDSNRPLAREFGSDPPTYAPTVLPEWEDSSLPFDIPNTFFNYDPNAESYGPDYWDDVEQDGYYDQLRRLDVDTGNNRCGDGSRQSPRDLCDTNEECVEFHMPRPRAGQYGLREPESLYRPTPMIMHNKLRLSYPERRSENEMPEPPGIDFANNVFNSGVQDLVNIDIKVRSEHRLCGKQYDGEMQLFHVHHETGNLEALSILIEAGGDVVGEMGREDNPHFQVLLDFFQRKFDEDAGLCLRRQRRARALFFDRGGGGGRGGAEEMNARSAAVPRAGSSSFAIDDDDNRNNGDQEEEAADRRENAPSLVKFLYRKIRDRFESLVARRLEEKLDRWNPMEPWYNYRSVHFWGYSGSITEPPCFQGVNWRVLDVPMRISMRQYIQLKTLMFDHVDPDTCQRTSTHFEESNARPVQPWTEGGVYRCRRSDYTSDMERAASGRRKGFVLEEKWWGVDNFPYVYPEFPEAG